MLDQYYERLVGYVNGMIADGVQLIHGGHLFDWSDTNIKDLLKELDNKKDEISKQTYEVGDLLLNIDTGQKSVVILIDKENVQLLPVEKVVIIPKGKVGYHYKKSKPGE